MLGDSPRTERTRKQSLGQVAGRRALGRRRTGPESLAPDRFGEQRLQGGEQE